MREPDASSRTHEPAGFFVLRTPAWPLDVLGAAKGMGFDAWVEERMTQPVVREAIYLASPSLMSQWDDRHRRSPEAQRGLALAVLRYLERMASRPTPFGLFASCTLGRMAAETCIELGPLEQARRHTRLDHDYLDRLSVAIGSSREGRAWLRYRTNSSLCRVADRWRLNEATVRREARDYSLVSLAPDEALDTIVKTARAGATRDQLGDGLRAVDASLDPLDVEAYLDALIEAQVLVAEDSPGLTGAEKQHRWARALAAIEPLRATGSRIEQVLDALSEVDTLPPGIDAGRYVGLRHACDSLLVAPEADRFVQVDLTRPALEATLGGHEIDSIHRGIRALRAFAPPTDDGDIKRFREAFVHRYQQREIPLMEALDPEIGIGYPPVKPGEGETSPWLKGLGLGGRNAGTIPHRWHERDAVLLRKLAEALSSGATVITLDSVDIEALENEPRPPLPDAFAVLVSATGRGAEPAQLYLRSVCGPSGARLLGRFCDLDPDLLVCVRAHLAAEEAAMPDAVFAEIVHLPEGRAGNVVTRPQLRGWEIPFLGVSGAPIERQIEASDLRVSVQGERVVLRSARLGCEVAPRMATAHNFNYRTVPLYGFLGALQGQGVDPWLCWTWGPLETAPFLPRVEAQGVVLARACWTVPRSELEEIERSPDRAAAVRRWRERRRLPARVEFQEMDNELFVDLEDETSLAAFLDAAASSTRVFLVEHFPEAAESVVRGSDGGYAHEMVVPFHRVVPLTAATRRVPTATPAASLPRIGGRVFPPGTGWLYAQVFCGEAAADRLLDEAVRLLVQEVRAESLVRRWFFIRYDEPSWHLRLRFEGEPRTLSAEVLPRLHQALAAHLESGLAHRLVLETYDREVERYGGPEALSLCEGIFESDSDQVLASLGMLAGDEGAQRRGSAILAMVDRLFQDLGLDSDARLELCSTARDLMSREFGGGKSLRIRLGDRFRKERKRIESVLGGTDPNSALFEQVLSERSRRIAQPVRELRGLESSGHLRVGWMELAASLVHMAVNRLARSSPREHELVVYDTLGRVEESHRARRRTLARSRSAQGEQIAVESTP